MLLKGNRLHYCKCLTELLIGHFKLVSVAYHYNPPPLFFWLFGAAPVAYGGSQARD